MKLTQSMLIVAVALIQASCSSTDPAELRSGMPAENGRQRQYLALPGQEAVKVGTEDADAAFDRQVNAYAQDAGQQTAPAVVQDAPVVAGDANNPAMPIVQADPLPVAGPAAPAVNTAPGTADYAVQITNGTTGRLYVEAQDAAGHIFPCGPMFAGQSINALPDPIGPLKGPITVVVRDPDKPGTPEIRRYQVQPPASYSGKTVGVTILPGGQYRADVDNEVYYTSPAPTPAASSEGE